MNVGKLSYLKKYIDNECTSLLSLTSLDRRPKMLVSNKSKLSKKLYRKIRLISLCALFTIFMSINKLRNNEGSQELLGFRKLQWITDTEKNCTPASIHDFPPDIFTVEQRSNGAVVVHILLSCYLFIFLAYVCDDYFVPSIKTLTNRLGMSEDVAGATFMAAATSSPEMFINGVGTFITHGDIGVGTIVGSAVFNILAVPACCGLLGGQTVAIDWWPLTRDCSVYGLTVILLIICMRDGRVEWYEALIMVFLYLLYIAGMIFNDAISNKCRRRSEYKEVAELYQKDLEVQPLLKGPKVEDPKPTTSAYEGLLHDTDKEDNDGLFDVPSGFWSRSFFFFSWPIMLILYLTVPDCRQPRRQWLWPLTFAMCVAWIASISYLVSWLITIIGDTLLIPDSVMGLTLLAAGMSVPEAASSVIVTNQGHGSMGISSSIGSNTFDILLCLGFPWLIKSTFLPDIPNDHFVQINSQGLSYNTVFLLGTLVLLYLGFALNRFVLDRKIGLLCLVMYLSFLGVASMVEMNVFGLVNLPTCPS